MLWFAIKHTPPGIKNTPHGVFFIPDGGDVPGSAGCIDLTSGMPGFAEWFKNNGKDLIIKVEY